MNTDEIPATNTSIPPKKRTVYVSRSEWEAEQRKKREERSTPRNLRREEQQIGKELRAARKGENKYRRMFTRGRKFVQTRRK